MTMPTRYVRTSDGRLVAVPALVAPPEEEIVVQEPEGDGISDLFEGPKREEVSDVFETTEETEVSNEDVMGEEEEDPGLTEEDEDYLFGVAEPKEDVQEPPSPQKPKIRRTIKRYPSPPTTLGEMR